MPLCRISLQSPAGAARGQVYNLNRRPIGLLLDACILEYYYIYIYISLQADDIENEANELIRIKNYLYGKLAEHTGHSVEKARSSHCMNLLSKF